VVFPLRTLARVPLVVLSGALLALASGGGSAAGATGWDGPGLRPLATAASAPASKPYLSGAIANGPRSRWQMTPDDASLFPAVPGPDGGGGVSLVSAPTGPNPLSTLSSRWVMPGVAHAGWAKGRPVARQDTWYRVRMMFPSDRYVPTRGEWNWVVEWHNDDRTASYPGASSIAVGVYTDYTGGEGSPGQNPRLAFRLMGGDVRSPQAYTVEMPSGSLEYDHWYDLTFHIVWSPDPDVGLAEWWADGTPMTSKHFPTLYTRPDGSHSYNGFGIYNYRLQADWASEVHFGDVKVGPDVASVGGQSPQMFRPSPGSTPAARRASPPCARGRQATRGSGAAAARCSRPAR
jgi:hypothetical protein